MDLNEIERGYRDAATRKEELQNSISHSEAKDIAELFFILINEDHIEEPYLTDTYERVLKLLSLKKDDINPNANTEEIKQRLSKDYSFYGKIQSICGFCCLRIDSFAPIFQKFVYGDEYKNLVKYSN